MMKRLLSLCVLMIFALSCLGFPTESAENKPGTDAECAVLMDALTGKVIFSQNAVTRHSMASTTKIMTALLAIKRGKLTKEYTVTADMINAEGSSLGLKAGDKITLYDLVCGMMLESGNDAANAIANIVGGSLPKFAVLMNEKAEELGMECTNFVTPSGLDDDAHYSTAYDMALLARYALRNETFLKIVSSKRMTVSFGNPKIEHTVVNHNRLLSSYEGTIGVKTGFTKKSGRCLVSAAERNGVRLIAVTLNDPNDWRDHANMFDYGFSLAKSVRLDCKLPKSTVSVVGGECNYDVIYSVQKTVKFASPDDVNIERKIILPRFLYAPVGQGEGIGKILFYCDGVLIAETPVRAYKNIKSEEQNETRGLIAFFKNLFS